jgi:TonB family protein
MGSILIYAIESSICLTLLWVFYEIALKNDTRHTRNRYFLLASMVFSTVAPLFEFSIAIPGRILPGGGLAAVLLPEVIVTPSGMPHEPDLWQAMLPVLYMAGVIISTGFMATGFVKVFRYWKYGVRKGRVVRIESRDPVCFSAFGKIFLSSSVTGDNASRMIRHEMKHIALAHHADLLFAGVIELIQWFNPAAYMIRRSLQALHEFEADSSCIRDGEEARSYQELLLQSVLKTRTPLLSNTFSNSSLLKNRIIMMTKKRTGSSASLKLFIALPLVLILLLAFSCKNRTTAKEAAPAEEAGQMAQAPDEVYTTADVMPVFQDDTTHHALMQWVISNMAYPDEAKKNGIQGRVIVKFVIDENGNVTDPEIAQGADSLLDRAALDLVSKCPQWSPGLIDGKPVKVSFSLPINFALQ